MPSIWKRHCPRRAGMEGCLRCLAELSNRRNDACVENPYTSAVEENWRSLLKSFTTRYAIEESYVLLMDKSLGHVVSSHV